MMRLAKDSIRKRINLPKILTFINFTVFGLFFILWGIYKEPAYIFLSGVHMGLVIMEVWS